MNKIIIMACMALGWFMLLYLVAFLANLHYRSDEDVLWVNKSQWEAIFLLWAPCMAGIVIGWLK